MHVGTDFLKLPPVTGQYWSLFQCSMLGTGGTCVSFSADGLQRGHTCLLQAIAHLAVSPTGSAPLYSSSASFSADGLQRPLPTCPFRRMVCRAPLLVLFGERSPIHISYLFRALLLVLPSRRLVYTGSTHGLHLHISPTSFCPFRRMVCTYSPTCPLLPVVHPQPIVSTGQHCVHHSSCPIGPSPWWRCTLHSITIMKRIILLPKEPSFRPPCPWWTLHSIIMMKIILLLLSPNSCRLGVVKLPG